MRNAIYGVGFDDTFKADNYILVYHFKGKLNDWLDG